MKTSRRFVVAAAVYAGILGWVSLMSLSADGPDAGAETISIVKPGPDEIDTAVDGFVEWRGAKQCTPEELSAPRAAVWTTKRPVRDQPGPQLAWADLSCPDGSRARFSRMASNARSSPSGSSASRKTVAHLHLDVHSLSGVLKPLLYREVNRMLDTEVENTIHHSEGSSTNTEVRLNVRSVSLSDFRFEVTNGLRVWTRYRFDGVGTEYDCGFCFIPNPFTFSGDGVFAIKVQFDRDGENVTIVRNEKASTGITLDKFETNISDIRMPGYCKAFTFFTFGLGALICDQKYRDEHRAEFESAVRAKLRAKFYESVQRLNKSIEKLVGAGIDKRIGPTVSRLRKLIEGSELSLDLRVLDGGAHFDFFVTVASRWLDRQGTTMAGVSDVELLRVERRQAINVKLSYGLLNLILDFATRRDISHAWESLRELVPEVEEAAGTRMGETIEALAQGIRHFGLRFVDPVSVPIFVFPHGERSVGVAVPGVSLFRATDPYLGEDVTIRLWLEGRVGLGRTATPDDIRFLRSHVTFEPLADGPGGSERILERYRQLSSIVLDLFEGRHNDWTALLSKERRKALMSVHDAIPEIFEIMDKFQPPYRIEILGDEKKISLRNDPSQYALVANIQGSN